MQTTLLGLAIAIILALVAALVAPLVVDWNDYRATIEDEASDLTGLHVRVKGPIDARILPSPVITLHSVEIGGGAAGGAPQLRAGMLKLELALGSLLRGEVRATEAHLIAPQISLGLDRSGAIDWPALPPSMRPETFSISRLNVEDGRITLSDAASGSRIVLQKLWFNGDVRSFLGPFKGEGAFVLDDELYGYRIAGSRAEDTGGIKIRLGVDPSDRPLTTDFEGILTFDRGVPAFDGTVALARPVGATLASGRRVMNEPWHAGGRIQATPASASLQNLTFQYGPEERALNFTGRADLTFGEHPHLQGALTALQVNVDRALAAPDLTHKPPLLVVKNFLQAFSGATKLPIPADVSVGVDGLTVGGTTIESLRGDLHFDRSAWSLNRFEFRAPGLTQVNLSGQLTDTPQGFSFSGPGALQSDDVDMLLAWLKGRGDLPSGQVKTLSAKGNVTIASDRVAVDGLTATLGQETMAGRLAYNWPLDKRPAALDADLRAEELDLDALMAFAKTAVADDGFALPQQGALALDIGKATYASVDARSVKAQVTFDAGKLHIDRLSIGELGGAKLDVGGRIDELSSHPRGQLTLDLDARALTGLTDIVGKFWPQAADSLRRVAGRLAPAKIHGVLNVKRASAGSNAEFHLSGGLAAMHLIVDGEASGEPAHLGDAVLRTNGRLEVDDGTTLMALLGLDHTIAVDQLPGRMTVSATGPLDGDLRVDGQVSASGFDAAVQGTLRLDGETAPLGALRLLASAGDLRPLHQAMTGQPGAAVPLSARAALAIAGTDLSFTDIAVAVDKATLRGRLAVTLANPVSVNGDIEADRVDAAAVTALLLGLPANAQGGGIPWSNASIGGGVFAAIDGSVTFKLDHAVFTPALVARGLTGVVRLRSSEISLDNLDGTLAGGQVTGALAVRRDTGGLAAHARIDLSAADAAIIAGPAVNIADGRLNMSLQCDGLGASPLALIGSLHGSSTMALRDAHFAGLDVAAFEAAIKAADQGGGSIDAARIESAVNAAMANGRLAVLAGDAIATVTSGRLNLTHMTLQAQDGAELGLDGAVDLGAAAVDLRMTLSGQPPVNALIRPRPELTVSLKGPLAAPRRALDISALTTWLTLRGAELQSRRLELIEANRRDGAIGPIAHPDSPSVHTLSPGTVVETAIAPELPAARTVERLQQPPPPPAAPDQTRSGTGAADQGAGAAPAGPVPLVIRPLDPKAVSRAPSGATGADAADVNRRRTAPAPQPAAPSPIAPAERSWLDLFRSQN